MRETPESPQELDSLRARVKRLEGELQASRKELAAERRQRKLLQNISRTLELEQLLYIFGEEIDRLQAFDGYLINLCDREHSGLVCSKAKMPASHAALKDAYLGFKFPFAERDANVRAFEQRQAVYIDRERLDRESGLSRHAFERWMAESMVIIPIPYGDTALGTVIGFRQHGPVDHEAVAEFEQRLLLFNEQIRNALLYTELKRQENQVQSALNEHQKFLSFISQVNSLTSPELIYSVISEEFVRAFGFDVASVTLLENDTLVAKHFACSSSDYEDLCERLRELHGDHPMRLDREEGASAIAFLQNIHVFLADAQPVLNLPMSPRDRATVELMGNLRTVLHMPIRRQDKAIGILGLYSLGEPLAISESDIKIIELLSSFVGTAITNAQLYNVIGDQKGRIEELNAELQEKIERLNELVNTDQLTGLNNFGAFKAELSRRTQEASRRSDKEELSVAILDVDHFKRFNDTYGHIAGNMVLQEVAQRIRQVIREMDVACRFGGEEFVVILPRCDRDGSRRLGERLREVMTATSFKVEDLTVDLSVSVGCATYALDESVEEFLERADRALYRAKQNGRNRTELAAEV